MVKKKKILFGDYWLGGQKEKRSYELSPES